MLYGALCSCLRSSVVSRFSLPEPNTRQVRLHPAAAPLQLMHRFQHTFLSRFVEYVSIVSAIARDVRLSAFSSAASFLVLALLRILCVFASLYLLYSLAHQASQTLSAPLSQE